MDLKSKRAKIIIAVIVALVILSASTGFMVKYRASQTEITLIGFDPDRAYEFESALTSLGPRPAGSPAEMAGAQYVEEQFKAAGLENVHIETFDTLVFEVRRAEVSLVPYGPFGQVPDPRSSQIEFEHTVDFVAQGHSGSRSWRYFTDDLDVVFVGNGSDDDLFQTASGSAALVEASAGSWSSNTELFSKADDYGVETLILHNTNSHEEVDYTPFFKGTGLPEGKSAYPDDIPFFMVSRSVGDEIKASSGNNQKLRINFDVIVETRKIPVTVGDVVGTERPDEIVMLGAHMDTVYNGPGAVDNTVGTTTIIELAHQLGQKKPKRTIRLATFGAEEIGLWGSRLYWEAHEPELIDNMKFMFNVDMNHADKDSMKISLLSDNKEILENIEKYKDKLYEQRSNLRSYKTEIVHLDPFPGNSDHYIFSANDIPFAVCYGSGSAEYHTYLDDISHINTESLMISGIIYGSYALAVANE